jgi:hypothetical protein
MAQRGRKKNEATKPATTKNVILCDNVLDPASFDGTANAATKTAENNDGLVELNHWVNNGSLSVDGEEYKIVGGKVKVKPEHVKKALEHINMRW